MNYKDAGGRRSRSQKNKGTEMDYNPIYSSAYDNSRVPIEPKDMLM